MKSETKKIKVRESFVDSDGYTRKQDVRIKITRNRVVNPNAGKEVRNELTKQVEIEPAELVTGHCEYDYCSPLNSVEAVDEYKRQQVVAQKTRLEVAKKNAAEAKTETKRG